MSLLNQFANIQKQINAKIRQITLPLNPVTNKIDNSLDKIAPYFVGISVAIHITYVLVLLGILRINSNLVETVNITIQILVCLLLMYRFRPFSEHKLRPYDTYLIFGSCSFLILTLVFSNTFQLLFPNFSKNIHTVRNTVIGSNKVNSTKVDQKQVDQKQVDQKQVDQKQVDPNASQPIGVNLTSTLTTATFI